MSKASGQEKCRIVPGEIEHRGWKTQKCSQCEGRRGDGRGGLCNGCRGSAREEVCQCGGERRAYDDGLVQCAIATATLGSNASDQLDILRAYRDRVAQYRVGSFFRSWYERIKRPVAAHIRNNQRHKRAVLRLFVQPMLVLLSWRTSSSVPRLVDVAGMPIYGAMLLWASLVYLLAAWRKQRG